MIVPFLCRLHSANGLSLYSSFEFVVPGESDVQVGAV